MQIIGTVKCRDTKKCRLWFDQRGIAYHFVDLAKRPLSPGELKAVAAKATWDGLIDKDGRAWAERQLAWKEYDPEEELGDDIRLMKTPVVREGAEVVIGYDPEAWERLAVKMRG